MSTMPEKPLASENVKTRSVDLIPGSPEGLSKALGCVDVRRPDFALAASLIALVLAGFELRLPPGPSPRRSQDSDATHARYAPRRIKWTTAAAET